MNPLDMSNYDFIRILAESLKSWVQVPSLYHPAVRV